MGRHDAAEVREAARGRWPDVIATLAPELRDAIDAGPRRHVPCPRHGGKDGLRVLPDFAESGGVVCNTCGAFADGFATLEWSTGRGFVDVLADVADALGMDPKTNGGRRGTPKRKPPAPIATKPDAEDAAKRRERLVKTWQATTADTGRLAAYLRSRGLSGDVPRVLRLHPALPYYSDGDPPVKLGTHPAMVAKVQDAAGLAVALHCTYLAPDGPGKADVPKPKKMQGPVKAAAVRLALPVDVLAVAEGIETALAVLEATGTPTYAALSAGGLESFVVPPSVKRIELWADNDASGRGQQAAETAAARLQAEGRAVVVLIPQESGCDWLDVLVRDGAEALKIAQRDAVPWQPQADAPAEADLETELDRLAALPILTYELERVEKAKALGIRAGSLDEVVKARRATDPEAGGLFLEDVKPWSDSVDGVDLLDELVTTEKRYLSLPPGAPEAMALWSIHTHAHPATEVSAILAITSPTPECGKTTCLTFIGAVVPRPLTGSNITTAALFRAVEKWKPTVLIDEADSFLKDNEELRGVLNSGHAKAGAWVIRTVGDNHDPTRFRTWAPKAIALIGKLPATLESRSIHIELRRLPPGETVTPLRLHQIDVLIPLQRKAARWALDHLEALRTHEPEIPPELYGRAADNWRSLFSIADLVGGSWPQRARQAAVTMSASRSEQTAGILLLEDVRTLFLSHGDRMQTTTILAALNDMDDRPWPEWSRGRELSARGLGRLLAAFDIHPRTIRMSDGDTPKGYLREQFTDSFTRYLPPSLSATPPQPADRAENGPSLSDTPPKHVADGSAPDSAVESQCGGVADSEPPQEGEDASLSEPLPSDPAFADESPELFAMTTEADGSRLVAL